MNTALMIDVANHIEHLEWGERPGCFGMRLFTHQGLGGHCGTPACIAGWTVAIGHDNPTSVQNNDAFDEARALLGLTLTEGVSLFMPSKSVACYYTTDPESQKHISPARAAAVLRHLAYTGIIDWSIRPEERTEPAPVEARHHETEEVPA